MPSTSVRTTGGDATVYFDQTGTGPNLVLVHGTAATREQWVPMANAVSDRFTVIAPDYSGSGDTADQGGPLTLTDLADEIIAAADAAGAGTFHLVGHSLGAVIAAQIAAHHPERVDSLVMHAGWAFTDSRLDAEFRYWLDILHSEDGDATFARMLPLMAFGPKYWDVTDPAANEKLVAELSCLIAPGADRQAEVNRTVDLRPLLGQITAPTLLLASTHDRIIDVRQQHALLQAIANSRYAEIDAGHGAPAEDPEGFIAKVAAFLDEQVG